MTTRIDDRWPSCETTWATLSVYTSRNHLSEISDILNVAEARTHTLTDVADDAATDGARPPTGRWSLESKSYVESSDLRRHVSWVCQRVSGEVLDRIRAVDGAIIRFKCTWCSKDGHGGPVMSPEQTARLVELGLEVEFDIRF